jgi:NAD(P)-dependent dehydrogenase (short-subunit alcohol dehydrogenase family)
MYNKIISELFCIEGKTIIVTGGLGQLGRQFSKTLLGAGANVAIFDPIPNCMDKCGKIFKPDNMERLICLEVDVTDAVSLRHGLDIIIDRWGVPHGLINNAALDSPPNAPAEENGPFETYPESSWDRIMTVNVKGAFLCCQIIGGVMAKNNRGSIINISSTYGIVSPDQRLYLHKNVDGKPFYKPVAYSASKSALINMTRYLSTYWAGLGVRVNTLTFGGVFNNQDEVFVNGYCSRVPLGRMALENEYNGAVVFLLSDASSYMTGANLVIDGGWTAW